MKMHERIAKRYVRGFSDQATMIALYPPKGLEEQVEPFADDEQDLHLTLVYLGELPRSEAKRAYEILSTMDLNAPEKLELDGWGTFANDGTGVRLLLWNNFGFDRLRVRVLDKLDRAGLLQTKEHGFIPHMTLEYHDGLDLLPENWGPEVTAELEDTTWPLDELKVVRGGKEIGTVEV